MKDILMSAIEDYTIELSEEQLNQFENYFSTLVDWNKAINLTAITDPEGVAVKHFADCLAFFNHINIPNGARVIDVGTGAGFPGVVLKIARPDIELTLLDSLNKRLIFLKDLLGKIDFEAELIHSRAEEGARRKDLREGFDFAVSRAVAQLNVLSEYCLPYVKVGGSFVALKGPKAQDEINGAANALRLLGGRVESSYEFELPLNGGERTILEIKKVKSTPKQYPRISAKIKANSL